MRPVFDVSLRAGSIPRVPANYPLCSADPARPATAPGLRAPHRAARGLTQHRPRATDRRLARPPLRAESRASGCRPMDIHADFNRYNAYKLDRRVNTFVYMNDDWPDSYGGHLELWGRDMKSCYQKILPVMGRFVVFSSTDFTYHGHPQPQTSPKGRLRRSIALYYFTNGRPAKECLDGDCAGNDHSTLFKKPQNCKVCEEATCKRYDETAPYWVDA